MLRYSSFSARSQEHVNFLVSAGAVHREREFEIPVFPARIPREWELGISTGNGAVAAFAFRRGGASCLLAAPLEMCAVRVDHFIYPTRARSR